MRYLLDEMYPPASAAMAQRLDLDLVSTQAEAELRGLSDAELFEVAQLDRRTLVSENARDLVLIEAAWRRDRGTHRGLVLTSNRSFPRHDAATFMRNFVNALRAQDAELDPEERSFVRWLRPT